MTSKQTRQALGEAYRVPHVPSPDELAAAQQEISNALADAHSAGVSSEEGLERLSAVLESTTDTVEKYTRYLAQQAGITPTQPV